MNRHHSNLRVMISGGGTGGHIFPALSIAQEIRKRYPESEIRFVGALGRMEMDKIPAAGFDIDGIPIAGISRTNWKANISLPFKLFKSLSLSRKLLQKYKPQIVIGTGGFASGPLLRAAQSAGIPTLIQEQNSYAGLTNKWLGKKAKAICVAYPHMEMWFPNELIHETGNPVRAELANELPERSKALQSFGLSSDKKTILVLGGSLGARSINQAVQQELNSWIEQGFQVIWQCGRIYIDQLNKQVEARPELHLGAFIQDMASAYASADIIISRAGAGTISELCLVGKPAILIPSPNVAEDHQTKNAASLSERGAAVLLPEGDIKIALGTIVTELMNDPQRQSALSECIKNLAKPEATTEIVDLIEKIVR